MTIGNTHLVRNACLLVPVILATCHAFSNPMPIRTPITLASYELQTFRSTDVTVIDRPEAEEFVATRQLFDENISLSQLNRNRIDRETNEYIRGYYLDSFDQRYSPEALGLVRPFYAISNKIKNLFRIDKSAISKLGVSFGLSYSALSQINGAISLSTAWYLSCRQTGLSPLAPGEWKSLLKAYGKLCAVLQLLKPIRIAAAIAMSKLAAEFLEHIQNKLDCSRGFAISVQYALGLIAQALIAVCGIASASWFSGVPVWSG